MVSCGLGSGHTLGTSCRLTLICLWDCSAQPLEEASLRSSKSLQTRLRPYGFVTAGSGFMYGATLGSEAFEWCPGDPNVPGDARITQIVQTPSNYGIAVDNRCRVWLTAGNAITRWVPQNGQAGVVTCLALLHLGSFRGINIDLDGFIWTSDTGGTTRLAVWNDSSQPCEHHSTDNCSVTHSGIGITFGGQIVNPSHFRRRTVTFFTYDENSNTITQTGCVDCPGIGPYNYNDFTGIAAALRAE
jgi:hypothetical protein